MKTRTIILLGSLVVVSLVLATHGAPAVRASAESGRVPQWERALVARSRGLDRKYRLGSFRPIAQGLAIVPRGENPGWLRALEVRSLGLDRAHHLGSFRRPLVMT